MSTLPTLSPSRASHVRGHPKLWKRFVFSLLTVFRPHGIIYVSGAMMNFQRITLLAVSMGFAGGAAMGQTAQNPSAEKQSDLASAAQNSSSAPKPAAPAKDPGRAEAYYHYTMGHIYEL